MTNSTFIFAVPAVVLLCAGCSESTGTTAPSTTPITTTEVYAGTLGPGGSGFYAFRMNNAGEVNITLASLTAGPSANPVAATLRLGLGIPASEGCEVTTSVTTPPGLRAQLTSQAGANIYCVQLSDPGGLATTVTFGVRIVHP